MYRRRKSTISIPYSKNTSDNNRSHDTVSLRDKRLDRFGQAFCVRATSHNGSCGLRRVFCPIRTVLKTGNTQSIPAFSELSAGPKSLAESPCPIMRCCPKMLFPAVGLKELFPCRADLLIFLLTNERQVAIIRLYTRDASVRVRKHPRF